MSGSLWFATVLGLIVALPAHSQTAHQELQIVAEKFQAALRNKDRAGFMSLLLHPDITWVAVDSDQRLAQDAARRPASEAKTKARVELTRTPASFIDRIVKEPGITEEHFAELQIDTDGDAASMAFDFRFLREGRLINVGREYWQLVRTEQGWKISAVTWSNQGMPPSSKEP